MPRAEKPVRPMRIRDAVFDLHKVGVARFDYRDPYHFAVSISWPAYIALAFGSMLTLNVVFALLYVARPGAVQSLPPGDVLRAFFFSLETLATVGYGEMAPASTYGHVVAAVEILTGMTFTAIFTGILFVRFSRPQARIIFADSVVISPHNGVPTLMLRIANGRLTTLTHAMARLAVMVAEVTEEGRPFRRIYDLRLQRDDLPIFPLTWTLMHVIDETSPLYGLGASDLEARSIRLYLAVEARDAAIGAVVQDLAGYMFDQVKFGMRYVDAVAVDEQGRVVADIARVSHIEAIEPMVEIDSLDLRPLPN
ncbi:MAG TPA: ion channel [Caulobacteraceae bacterium]|jgi:inward rectifier potassium channel